MESKSRGKPQRKMLYTKYIKGVGFQKKFGKGLEVWITRRIFAVENNGQTQ